MMKYLALCAAAGIIALAGSAAVQASPGATTQAAPAKPKKVQRVCRERQRSGSHLSNRVCKTPEEGAELQDRLDTEAELGIPGNKTATGRAIDRGAPRGGGPN